MATTLAPVDSREVVRCDHCLLVQFRTTNDLCRRCHASLDEEEPEIAVIAPIPLVAPPPGNGRGHLNLAASIRSLRLRNGLSQRQLATRMSVPRTYVSKIENEKATPTLSSLERLARALEVTVPDLLSGGERKMVSIARALAPNPRILLMDEPFGALDEQTRMILGEDLSVLLSQTEKTIVFVTHSLGEAVFLADRVAVFKRWTETGFQP